ncbi:hypothetical protein GCM10010885_17960 [Alicyclobacillus cellulosilyticus]|uniref:Stage IV sporulation protein n=1 Tax=Alicyclobacillus cellulosilyticus TaxID=1003997 RepID=A0A917KEW1_9BACL|nr:sporulation protein YqfD [Alicyclobacillus cellulosilyticus]GGJ09298.1 hypothetical protein GCM10010885_17960 [Alicyclobacillus cellulosilyticus]
MSRVPWEHRWRGAVRLELRGAFVARVLRDLHAEGVPLYDVRVGDDRCSLRIALGDFRALVAACRRHKVRLRAVERIGLPFAARRLRQRKVMWVGPVLFLCVLACLSSIIWQVDVSGTDDEDLVREVVAAARENGLYVGAWRWNLPEVEVLQARMLDHLPSLVWIGVQLHGAKAQLEVLPKIPAQPPAPAAPQDIVAAKPGTVLKVFATRGDVVVRPGQTVQPGQVLISGRLGDSGVAVAADGKVYAEVWYRSQVALPLSVVQQAWTGASVRRVYLRFGAWALHVWGWKQADYPRQVTVSDERDLRVFGLRLPVGWQSDEIREVEPRRFALTESAARKEALRLAALDVRARAGADARVLGQTVLQTQVEHGKLYETVLTRVEEDIGTAAPLPAAAGGPGRTAG